MNGLDNHSMLLCCVKCWQILDPALAVQMLNPELPSPIEVRGFFCLRENRSNASGFSVLIILKGKLTQLHPLGQHRLCLLNANALGR